MSTINDLIAENKQLRKQLKGENLRLYRDMEVYFSRYNINQEDLVNIKSQILIEFVQISNEGKSVWDTIGDPRDYCDKYLTNYEKKDTSILELLRKYIPLVVSILSSYILMDNYFSVYQQTYIDSSLVQITSLNLMKHISFLSLFFFFLWNDSNKLFIRNSLIKPGTIKFLIFWMIINAIGSYLMNDLFDFTIPKIYLYIILLVSIFQMYYNKKIRKS